MANSIFTENKKRGLMICGYEWGYSKADQTADKLGEHKTNNSDAQNTFSNKEPRYGSKALGWRFDNVLLKWFELWGHKLSREGLGGSFERSIIQTNWCNTQAHQMKGDVLKKLLSKDQVDNFLFHIEKLDPQLIVFAGSKLIQALQYKSVLERFEKIMGHKVSAPEYDQEDFPGRRFKVAFQEFENCKIVCLPHPSGSRGLADEYMAMFKPRMSGLLESYKQERRFKL